MEMCKINNIMAAVALSMSLLVMAFALATVVVATGESQLPGTTETSAHRTTPPAESNYIHLQDSGPSLRRVARALARYGNGDYNRRPATATCDKFPKACRADGSPGPDCCGKRCVNTKTDDNNCGWCGIRCWYGSVCCGGRCVGILYDPANCGRCGNKCKKGRYCRYGMCSYGY